MSAAKTKGTSSVSAIMAKLFPKKPHAKKRTRRKKTAHAKHRKAARSARKKSHKKGRR